MRRGLRLRHARLVLGRLPKPAFAPRRLPGTGVGMTLRAVAAGLGQALSAVAGNMRRGNDGRARVDEAHVVRCRLRRAGNPARNLAA